MNGLREKNNPFIRPKVFYDMEVYSDDWFICFEYEDGTKETIHNGGIIKLLQIVNKYTLVGYNNYHYDDKMLSKIINGCTNPAEVKQWNDKIIVEKENWWTDFKIVSLDAFVQLPTYPSLKMIESWNGSKIKETSVGFDIGRKLTEEELASEMEYCFYDVSYARKVYENRSEHWALKEYLYSFSKDDKPRSFAWRTTSASAHKLPNIQPSNELIIPEKAYEILPQDVIDLWKNGKTDAGEDSVTINTKHSNVVIMGGGIHGGRWGTFRNVRLWDVQSLYPSIMIKYKLLGEEASQSLDDDKTTRLLEKASLDNLDDDSEEYAIVNKSQNNKKLFLNSIYGLTGAEWSKFYSPNLRLSVCIIGQVMIFDLILRLETLDCIAINNNTDGVGFITPDDIDEDALLEIKRDWERDWGMVLTEERYDYFNSKDVNNYLGIEPDGSVKSKGGFLTKHDILDSKFILQPYKNPSVNKVLLGLLLDLTTGGEFSELSKLDNSDEFIKDVKKHDSNLDVEFMGSNIKVFGSNLEAPVYIPYTKMTKKLSIKLKSQDHNYVHNIVNNVMDKNGRELLNNKITQLYQYIRVQLMKDFEEHGILGFTSHISINDKYGRFTTSLSEFCKECMDGNGELDTLQKVNRYFVANDGHPVYKVKHDMKLSDTGAKEQLVANAELRIINDDINNYDIKFTDIDVNYYTSMILQRLFTWVSNSE